ncbi:MAG: YigZ family protein [Bacteroidota bacterium]|nr:YigZ family protein [Bacteroidota bacterium]
MIQDSYQTIISFLRNEIKILNSRFIASAYPVSAKEETDKILQKVRKEFYDANHNCFAYRIGMTGKVFRYSDDGEPSGTAGVKIFSAIRSKNLSDVLVIVTRYFGGTKLGVGGLSRAYHDSALSVLKKVKVAEKITMSAVRIKFPYDFTSQVMYLISKYNVSIVGKNYQEDVEMEIEVRLSLVSDFGAELFNTCSGNVQIKKT